MRSARPFATNINLEIPDATTGGSPSSTEKDSEPRLHEQFVLVIGPRPAENF